MNNILVYCEIEEGKVADVSLELVSKAAKLAEELKCKVEAVVAGHKLDKVEEQILPFGADIIHKADAKVLSPYTTLPHTKVMEYVIEKNKPQIALVGATSIGRDLGPRVSGRMRVGLTADCTDLVIGEYTDGKTKKEYTDLLYQIRPAFGGNIIATIVNPDTRPQMATVREGVMKKEEVTPKTDAVINDLDTKSILKDVKPGIEIIERHLEERKVNLTGSQIIVAGGFGVGSKGGFDMLHELAELIGGEVGASRAAVDAGFVDHERQVGQTGVTVRPKLYIAVGISGAVQHSAGMDGSSQIISINTDPDAPLNKIADYAIIGDYSEVIPKMIKYYKEESK